MIAAWCLAAAAVAVAALALCERRVRSAALRRRFSGLRGGACFLTHGIHAQHALSCHALRLWPERVSFEPAGWRPLLLWAALWPVRIAVCAARRFVPWTPASAGELSDHTAGRSVALTRLASEYTRGAGGDINAAIETTARTLHDEYGVHTVGLGMLNKAGWLNSNGAAIADAFPSGGPWVVSGNALTAALVVRAVARVHCRGADGPVGLVGATGNIGRAVARSLGARGVAVVAFSRSEARVTALRAADNVTWTADAALLRGCRTWVLCNADTTTLASMPPSARLVSCAVPTPPGATDPTLVRVPWAWRDGTRHELDAPHDVVHACHAEALLHAVERRAEHAVGEIDWEHMDALVVRAAAAGFQFSLGGPERGFSPPLLPRTGERAADEGWDACDAEVLAALQVARDTGDDVWWIRAVFALSLGLVYTGYAVAGTEPVGAAVLCCLGWNLGTNVVAHHIQHGSFRRFHGTRWAPSLLLRALVWPDWLEPAAWRDEHNLQHHVHLGERGADPDHPQHVVDSMLPYMPRFLRAPGYLRGLLLSSLFALCWKWAYFGPNCLAAQSQRARRRRGRPARFAWTMHGCEGRPSLLGPLCRAFSVPVLVRAAFVPAAWFAAAGPSAAWRAAAAMALAELLHNIQAAAVILVNHAGEDVASFSTPCPPHSREARRRAVLGSVNLCTLGMLPSTLLFNYLDFQVEHHLDDRLTPLACARAAPHVRAACARHGIAYRCEAAPRRWVHLFRIFAGFERMPPAVPAGFPGPMPPALRLFQRAFRARASRAELQLRTPDGVERWEDPSTLRGYYVALACAHEAYVHASPPQPQPPAGRAGAVCPGWLHRFPWELLGMGNSKYLFVAAGAWYSELPCASFLFPATIAARLLLAKVATALEPPAALQALSEEQRRREARWDDFLVLQFFLVWAVGCVLPVVGSPPSPFDLSLQALAQDALVVAAVQVLVVEPLYYCTHVRLHRGVLWRASHSHHHASRRTQAVTGSVHPLGEHVLYTALFALPLLASAAAGTYSSATAALYTCWFDVCNMLGHCNFFEHSRLPGPLSLLFYDATFHRKHHTRRAVNFSLFMPLFDHLGGTALEAAPAAGGAKKE